MCRDDGKAFKLNSLKTLDAEAVRLPSRVEAERPDKEECMTFPEPDLSELRCGDKGDVLLTLDDATAAIEVAVAVAVPVTLDKREDDDDAGKSDGGQARDSHREQCTGDQHMHMLGDKGTEAGASASRASKTAMPILEGVTAQVTRSSRIAIVGDNGSGKTTLLRLLCGDLSASCGSLSRRAGLRIALVQQHHLDALKPHLNISAAQYMCDRFGVTMLEARGKLAKFGLCGDTAVAVMGTLSGGQRVRVSLTAVTWTSPHLILLDEPTNHLDASSVRALACAVNSFAGAVVMVSHDRAFCVACCTDLWVVDKVCVPELECVRLCAARCVCARKSAHMYAETHADTCIYFHACVFE